MQSVSIPESRCASRIDDIPFATLTAARRVHFVGALAHEANEGDGIERHGENLSGDCRGGILGTLDLVQFATRHNVQVDWF
jgi:hypothetical protein